MKLLNQKAFISGGSRGIGKAIVLELAKEGADIAFTYKNSKEASEELVKEVTDLGRSCIALKSDAASFEDSKKVVSEAIETLGGIDIVVNNAGIIKDMPLMMMSNEDWKNVMHCNLDGVFNITRAAIVTMMKQKKGCVINMSSVSGVQGMEKQANYSASKAGAIGFTRSLAREVAPFGIRVNAIAPGFIDTEMLHDIPEKKQKELYATIPLKRLGKAHEVAKLAVYLASSDAEYITGQVIVIDGGLTA